MSTILYRNTIGRNIKFEAFSSTVFWMLWMRGATYLRYTGMLTITKPLYACNIHKAVIKSNMRVISDSLLPKPGKIVETPRVWHKPRWRHRSRDSEFVKSVSVLGKAVGFKSISMNESEDTILWCSGITCQTCRIIKVNNSHRNTGSAQWSQVVYLKVNMRLSRVKTHKSATPTCQGDCWVIPSVYTLKKNAVITGIIQVTSKIIGVSGS